MKEGPQTFVLWVLRSSAALLLTQSLSDPWVGAALALVVFSARPFSPLEPLPRPIDSASLLLLATTSLTLPLLLMMW